MHKGLRLLYKIILATLMISFQVALSAQCTGTPMIIGESNYCEGDFLEFSATGINTYLWSTGETTPTITIAPTSDLTIWVKEGADCTVADTLNIMSYPLLEIDPIGPLSVCDNETVLLSVLNPPSSDCQYIWEITSDRSFSVIASLTDTFINLPVFESVSVTVSIDSRNSPADCNYCISLPVQIDHFTGTTSTLIDTTICPTDSIMLNGIYYTPGNYSQVFEGFNGCDSTLLINIEDYQSSLDRIQPATVADRFTCDSSLFVDLSQFPGTIIGYQWQVQELGASSWIDLLGETSETLPLTPLGPGVYAYRLVIFTGEGCELSTNFIQLEFPDLPYNITNSGPINLCQLEEDTLFLEGNILEECLNEPVIWEFSTNLIDWTTVFTDSFSYVIPLGDRESGFYRVSSTPLEVCDCHTYPIQVNILSQVEFFIDTIICANESIMIGDSTYTTTGMFVNSFPSPSGCDSIVNLTLAVLPEIETNLNESICFGESFSVGSSTYNTSGNFTDILTSFSGCDSIVNLTLQVEQEIITNLDEFICFGETFSVGNSTYNSSGNFTDILTSFSGCDSIVNLTLQVEQDIITNLDEFVCFGGTFTVGNSTYNTSGNFTDILTSLSGCDSIVNLTLQVEQEIITNLDEFICFGETFSVGNSTYNTSGNFTDILTSFSGCDSIVNLTLQVEQEIITNLDGFICFGETFSVGSSTYNTSGNFTDILTSFSGCDSIVNLTLQVEQEIITNLNEFICFGETFSVGSSTYNTSGNFTDILTSFSGCDSIVNLSLVVEQEIITNLDEFVCFGETFTVGNSTYNTSGNFTDILTSLSGCDSIVNLTLQVEQEIITNLDEFICFGETFSVGNSTYNTSGNFTDILTSFSGCDSIVNLTLQVAQEIITNLDEFICFGETFSVGSSTYNASGNFTDILTSFSGCDSIVNLTLQVEQEIITNLDEFICFGETFSVGSSTYNTSGNFTDILTTFSGCDSIVNLSLVVEQEIITNLDEFICFGETFSVGNNTYNTSGNFTDILTTFSGCDSIVNLTLQVAQEIITNLDEFICFGETFSVGSSTYNTSGNFTDILTSFSGCDSIVNLSLVVEQEIITNLDEFVCFGETFTVGNSTYNTSGNFTDILTSLSGCDSIVNLTLQVEQEIITNLDEFVCFGETFSVGNSTYNTSGNFTDILTSFSGCDSIVNLTLQVEQEIITNLNEFICFGETFSVGNSTYNTSGNFTDILTSFSGCDSIVNLTLQVEQEIITNLDGFICFGETFSVGSSTYNTSGNFTDILTSFSGCDSIVNLTLQVEQEIITNLNEFICFGETFSVGSSTYNTSGNFTDILTSLSGCDSIVNLTLQVEQEIITNLDEFVCFGETFSVGNSTYNTSGNYTDILTSDSGCDSTVNLMLLVEEQITTNLEEFICNGESFIVGTSSYDMSGSYTDILTNVSGCDSIVNLNLTVIQSAEEFISATICEGDTYQVGGQSFSTTGNYTVTVQNSNCNTIVHLNLFVDVTDQTILDETICNGDVYQVGFATYSTPGFHITLLSNQNGCDSFVLLDLSVLPVFITDIEDTICVGDSYTIGGQTYTESGFYVSQYSTSLGCDSTVSLLLEVIPFIENEIIEEICFGETYEFNNQIFSESGIYQISTNTSNCPGLTTLNLTVGTDITNSISASICEGETVAIGTAVYSVSGLYENTLTSTNGCDSLVILDLTVNETTTTDIFATICEGETYQLGTNSYTETGNYTETFVGQNACDSVVNLSLILINNTEEFLNETICQGETIELGNQVFDTSGIYTVTVDNGICNTIFNLTLNVVENTSTLVSQTICEGETITIGTAVYATSGIYENTFVSINGCDSLVTLDLTVNENITNDIFASICEGESYVLGNTSYSESGIYSETFVGQNSCDSIVNLSLTVLDNSEQFLNETICEDETFELGGQFFDTTGNYTVTVENGDCNTIYNLDLNVLENISTQINQTICEGEIVAIGTAVYSTSGIYENTLVSINGCDSLVTLDLTVNENITNDISVSICEGESYVLGNTSYSESGIYSETFVGQNSCDSIVNLSLTVLDNSEQFLNETICEDETFELGGQTFNTTGNYTVTIENGDCNTIYNLDLNVLENISTQINQTICEGETFAIGTAVYSTSGIYENTLVSINGCDSLVTLDLTVNENITNDISVSICEGESYVLGNTSYSESGIYSETFVGQNSCDSIVNLSLTVLDNSEQFLNETICEDETFELGGQTFNTTGNYTVTIENGDCNTIYNLDLNVLENISTQITQTICEGETVTIGTAVYSTTGIYENTLVSINGCDSLVTLDLTVNENITNDISVSICEGESYVLGNTSYSESGIYSETFVGQNSCDSIVNLSLTVLDNSEQFLNETICEDETFELGGQFFDTTGNYTVTIENGDCNTIYNLDLNVLENISTQINQTICEGEIVAIGTAVYSTSGIYENTLVSINGCDSLVTLDLTVNEIISTDISISICEGESFVLGNTAYSESGIYSETFVGQNSCDSIVNLSLTVLDNSEQFLNETICEDETFELGGQFFDTTGNYTVTIENGDCNTIYNLDLNVLENISTQINQTICEGEIVAIGTAVYSTSGIYENTLVSINGCDSLVTLDLTVNEIISTDISISICEGESFVLGNTAYSESGIYSETFISQNTCDSIVNLTLIVLEDEMQFINANFCEGSSFELGGEIFDTPGIYNFTIENGNCSTEFNLTLNELESFVTQLSESICQGEIFTVGTTDYTTTGLFETQLTALNGCDSLVTLDLTVTEAILLSIDTTICDGTTFQIGTESFTETGVYTGTISGNNSCDTTVNLTLTVLEVSQTELTETICAGETFTIGNDTYSTSGIYNNQLIAFNGCDSLVTLNLTVTNPISSEIDTTICVGDSYQIGNNFYTETGFYSDTLIGQNNCDSTVNLTLLVLEDGEQFINTSFCEGSSIEVGGQVFDTAGAYMFTVENGICNTIINLTLTETASINISRMEEICTGETISIGSSIYSETGFYQDTLSAFSGCDSIVSLTLTVTSLPTLIVQEIIPLTPCGGDQAVIELTTDAPGDFLFTIDNGQTWQTTPIFENLGSGLYEIGMSTLDTACINVLSEVVEIEPTVPEITITDVLTTAPDTCVGDNGQIVIVVTSDNDDLLFSIDDGANFQSTPLFAGLGAGTYEVLVTDLNGLCEINYSEVIEFNTPSGLATNLTNLNLPACQGDEGDIGIEITGGTLPYQVAWSNGDTTTNLSITTGGLYQLSVTDNNGCEDTLSILVPEPGGLDLNLSTSGDTIICLGETLTLTAGPDDYNYQWSNTTGPISNASEYTLNEADEIWVTVEDDQGCQSRDTIEVNFTPDSLKAEFLIPIDGLVDLPIVAVDITWPIPDQVIWSYDLTRITQLDSDQNQEILLFNEPGDYTISMQAYFQGCIATVDNFITIFEDQDSLSNPENITTGGSGILNATLFPNPNDGEFTAKIRMANPQLLNLYVFNAQGIRMDFRQNAENINHVVEYDIDDLKPGVYALIIQSVTGWRQINFVVK